MALQQKYKQLIDYANTNGVTNLTIQEQNNVLYVSGKANEKVKEGLWSIYNQLDPDMRSGDMVLNIESAGTEAGATYTVVAGDNLTKIARKYPGLTWNDIFRENTDQLTDPDKIFPGQVLRIPGK